MGGSQGLRTHQWETVSINNDAQCTRGRRPEFPTLRGIPTPMFSPVRRGESFPVEHPSMLSRGGLAWLPYLPVFILVCSCFFFGVSFGSPCFPICVLSFLGLSLLFLVCMRTRLFPWADSPFWAWRTPLPASETLLWPWPPVTVCALVCLCVPKVRSLVYRLQLLGGWGKDLGQVTKVTFSYDSPECYLLIKQMLSHFKKWGIGQRVRAC